MPSRSRKRSIVSDSSESRTRSKSAAKAYRDLVLHSSTHFRADIEFHEKPRQVLFAAVLIGIVFLLSEPNNIYDPIAAARVAIGGCLIALVFYCMLQTKDGLMIRPHPIIWRAVHGMYLFYFVLLVFFIILPPKAGITFLHDLFPDIAGGSGAVFDQLSKKQPAHLLASDCEVNFNNIWRQVTSIWFLAHVGGYWAKMCLYRDWQMCLTYSVAFEIVELSLVWLVPEFEECWFDSIFLDVLGANMIGMLLGRATLRYLSCRDYDWEPSNENLSFWKQAKNLASRCMPFSWSTYNWPKNEKSWILTGVTWLCSIVIEFNAFVILHGLVVRPSHWIQTARLFLIGAQAAQSVPEWYEYVRGGTQRIGHNCWLMFVTMILELILGLRYGKGGASYGDKTIPTDILIIWALYLGLSGTWLLISSYRSRGGDRRSPNWLLYLRIIAHLPLLFLTRRWVF
jgi:phosphatidylserine synthase 2